MRQIRKRVPELRSPMKTNRYPDRTTEITTLYKKFKLICIFCRFALYILKDMMMYNTGCPNKHGNSVTNSISSLWIILWFSIVIPIEKAVICKSFVCYVHILFVYVLTAYGCTVYKQSKLVRLHCSSCGDIIDTFLQSFTISKK